VKPTIPLLSLAQPRPATEVALVRTNQQA